MGWNTDRSCSDPGLRLHDRVEMDTLAVATDHRVMAATVGRDLEWSAIEAFLDRSVEGPAVLVIEGAAGIGKSTLWLDAVDRARERGYAVHSSRPAETERLLANVVLGDLFEDVRPEELATLPPPRRRAFESALLMRDAPTEPVDPRALGVAILTLLPVLVARGPVLFAIDDDQWMDPSSAATLSFAFRRLQGQPLRLLLCRRLPEAPPIALEEAFPGASVKRLSVGPLSVGALHEVLRERLGAVFPRPMQLRVHEVSGGNPFYALEIARTQPPNRSRAATTTLALPPSLERVLEARLGKLDGKTRQALLLIAAHGRFPVRALGTSVRSSAIERTRRAGVIEIAGGVARFTHPLFASAIYLGATDDERRAAHRSLATIVQDPVHRARHLALSADAPDAALAATIESAANLARDLGVSIAAAELAEHALRLTAPQDIDDRTRRASAAVRAYSAAGDGRRARAMAADLLGEAPAGRARAEALILASDFEAPGAAVGMLEEALVEAGGAPEVQATIHAGLAESIYFALRDQRTGFGEQHARASLRLAERLDNDALRANALSILALNRFSKGRRGALALAERAYRLAARLDEPRLLQKAGWAVGHVLTWVGDTDRARTWLERRLAEWMDRDERARADFLWYLALVEIWAGRWSIAGEYARQSQEINSAYGVESPFDFFPSALLALHKGEFEQARSLAERALSMDGAAHASYFAIIGVCELWSGSPEAAIVQLARAERAAEAVGSQDPSMRHWLADYVEALLLLGRIAEAADLTGDWEASARRLGRDRVLAQAVRCRGLIAAARGDIPTAIDLLQDAVSRHQAAGDPFGQARAELALGANRRRAQQKRSAREALGAALARFEDLGATTWADIARSELARIGGRSRLTGLSPSELTVAALVAEGRTNREIASALSLGERTIASHLTSIYAKLGIRSRTELARQFVPPPALPAESAGKVQ
jgi:DNA-binding CsgD family transcriptional regulator